MPYRKKNHLNPLIIATVTVVIIAAAFLLISGRKKTSLQERGQYSSKMENIGHSDKNDMIVDSDDNVCTSPKDVDITEKETAKKVNFYYYGSLSSEDKTIYDTLLEGIIDLDETISLYTTDTKKVSQIINMIYADHPEICWLEYSYSSSTSEFNMEIMPDYSCSKEEAKKRIFEIEESIAPFLKSVPNDADEYDRIKLVYEYMIGSVEYDMTAPDNQNLYSSLVNHKSICAGYAKGAQYLLQQVGIQVICISGEGLGNKTWGAHSWNIVRCNGNYYHFDCTFADSFSENSNVLEEMAIFNYSYLCVDDVTAAIDHDWNVNELPVPICVDGSLDYYKMNGIYSEVFDEEIWENIRTTVFSGKRYWMWKFSSQDAYQKCLSSNVYLNYVAEYLQVPVNIKYIQMDNNCSVIYWY